MKFAIFFLNFHTIWKALITGQVNKTSLSKFHDHWRRACGSFLMAVKEIPFKLLP